MNDWEYITCDRCNGKGETPFWSSMVDPTTGVWTLKTKFCLKCLGTDTCDWIEAVVGKDKSKAFDGILKHESTKWNSHEAVNPHDFLSTKRKIKNE